jgi:hypothetical protein
MVVKLAGCMELEKLKQLNEAKIILTLYTENAV